MDCSSSKTKQTYLLADVVAWQHSKPAASLPLQSLRSDDQQKKHIVHNNK
jgi:hypothetical protein